MKPQEDEMHKRVKLHSVTGVDLATAAAGTKRKRDDSNSSSDDDDEDEGHLSLAPTAQGSSLQRMTEDFTEDTRISENQFPLHQFLHMLGLIHHLHMTLWILFALV